MKKTEKTFFVEDLSGQLKSAVCVVLVDYSNLTVKMQQELKKRLREVDAKMEVVKNTLFRLAGKNAKINEDMMSDTVLSGPTAIIISEKDPVAPIQVLGKFTKEFEIPQFKVGIVEGAYRDKDGLIKLSTLPSKEVLFGQVVGSVAAPMYGIVGVLQGNLQKLLYILKTKSQS